VLLFPFKLAWWTARLGLRMLRLLWRFVREVLSPADAAMEAVGESDTLAVAARKVHRMRRPALLECLRMRAEFDPEYLGIMIPGCAGEVRHAAAAEIEEDLAQAGVESRTRDGFRRLAAARRRQVLELRRLLAQLDVPPMGPESMRAMTIAYTVDYHGVRSRLEAVRRLQQAFDEALGEGRPADGDSGGRWSLRAAWCRLRLGGRILRLVEQPAFAHLSQQQRAACVRLVCRRRRDLARAVRLLTRDPACLDALAAARQTLVAVGRDPATWSQQLVALRTVQTLSVLDLQTYCDLVAELGEYEPCPDDPARDFVDPNDPATL
jgi:hypothetical protein